MNTTTLQIDLTDDEIIAIKAEISAKHWLNKHHGTEYNSLDRLAMMVLLAAQAEPPKKGRKRVQKSAPVSLPVAAPVAVPQIA